MGFWCKWSHAATVKLEQSSVARGKFFSVLLAQRAPGTLSIEQWRERLPTWFVEKFAAEITPEEAERRNSLPLQQRAVLAERWSLGGWLYWFRPGERPWLWWSADIPSAHVLHVRLVVPGLPFPSGSFEWVLGCAGAKRVEKENLLS